MDKLTFFDVLALPTETPRPLSVERQRVAAEVFQNKEFTEYVIGKLDDIRATSLSLDREDRNVALDRLMEARGAAMALTEAFNFFRSCYNEIAKKTSPEAGE
jgi:hypothetical protein